MIGIDPGLTGAVAILTREGVCTRILSAPVSAAKGSRGRRTFVLQQMVEALQASKGVGLVGVGLVVLEKVGVRPMEGAVGAFTFGRGVGLWEGIIATLGYPMETPTPVRWKGKLGVPADKQAARFHAMSLFPDLTPHLARKKDDGRAEAVLLAEYGRRALLGKS